MRDTQRTSTPPWVSLPHLPYFLISIAGIADLTTSIIGGNLSGLVEVGGGTYLWILYFLGLTYLVFRIKNVPEKVRFWLPRTIGILCFAVPINNVLHIISALI